MYNRLSQSGPDAPAEANPPPVRRSSSRQRSKGATGKVGTAPLMADVQEDDYNDPPPPSAIRTYRESRIKQSKRKPPPTLDPPLLFTSFGDIPSPLSSPDARNDTRMNVPPTHSQLLDASSLQPLLTSPSTQSVQADSFLDRAFAASVEPGSSAEVLTAASSSQSHHTHVKLGATPLVATRVKPQPRTPVAVNSPVAGPSSPSARQSTSPPSAPAIPPALPLAPAQPSTSKSLPYDHHASQSLAMNISFEPAVPPMWVADGPRDRQRAHRRDSAQYYPEPGRFSPPSRSPQSVSPLLRSLPQSPPLRQATATHYRGSATPQYLPHYTPTNRYTPTRDKIVLPAPLAPIAVGSPTTPSSQTSSSPTRYSPPGLAGAPAPPPHRGPRRSSNAAYTPPYSSVVR